MTEVTNPPVEIIQMPGEQEAPAKAPEAPVIDSVKEEPQKVSDVQIVNAPQDKVPEVEADKEPKKPEWDKERQYKDELAAERKRASERESQIAEMNRQNAEIQQTLIAEMKAMKEAQPVALKEDPRQKILDELTSLEQQGYGPDEQEEYASKMSGLLKKVVLLEPEVKTVETGPSQEMEELKANQAALEKRLSEREGDVKLDSMIDGLDATYGVQHRSEAVEAAKAIIDTLPDGTPDEAVKSIYEAEYRVRAAASPPVEKPGLPNIPVNSGVGGSSDEPKPPSAANSSLDDYFSDPNWKKDALARQNT